MGHDHEKVVSGLICEKDLHKVKEAVCIQVEKVYDSCKEKDCIENARVIFEDLTPCEREVINTAFNVKIRKATVQDVITDIEPVPFKRGFYTVDIKYIIRVTLDFFTREDSRVEITTINGNISFDKKVILFGSEGSVKIFKSHFEEDGVDRPIKSKVEQDNLPMSKIEVAEPIPLNANIKSILDKFFEEGNEERLEVDETRRIPAKRVYVTVGIFSIIKLVRVVQLLIPAFDFCLPTKECIASTEENPCDLFESIEFPFDEFFPPQKVDFPGAVESERDMIEAQKHHGCCRES